MAAAAAIIVPDRRHDWQRPLPIMAAVAANPKGMVFFPLRHHPFPICCGRNALRRHSKSKRPQEQTKRRVNSQNSLLSNRAKLSYFIFFVFGNTDKNKKYR
ncbi:MAG: hypothetical protein IJ892_08415 [Prevotella sp.]|nr:hypothetical protein [Prevotella sp.]